jgi:hypothetical protein
MYSLTNTVSSEAGNLRNLWITLANRLWLLTIQSPRGV